MDWLSKLSGISPNNLMNVSVPKEKLVKNLKNSLFKMNFVGELENVRDIIYHAILRDKDQSDYIGELHIIEVSLNEPKYVKVIAEAFQKAIPYPKVIIFSSGEKYLYFHSFSTIATISQHQFTDWVYEEELLYDWALGGERQAESECADVNIDLCIDLPYQLKELFHCAESNEFICLRHLIDILKILEYKTGRRYVRPIISQLVDEDRIVYMDDIPFTLWSDANLMYLRRNPHLFSNSSMEDRRFGIDRQFEPLSADDFTTVTEVMDLLSETESTIRYFVYDEDRYESKEFDDYSEDYDDYE